MAIPIDIFNHEPLVQQIKAVGRELIRNAENLIPNVERINKFTIEIEFPIPSKQGIPEIRVTYGAMSLEYLDDIFEYRATQEIHTSLLNIEQSSSTRED